MNVINHYFPNNFCIYDLLNTKCLPLESSLVNFYP